MEVSAFTFSMLTFISGLLCLVAINTPESVVFQSSQEKPTPLIGIIETHNFQDLGIPFLSVNHKYESPGVNPPFE